LAINALSLEHIDAFYGDSHVLQDVSFELGEARMLGLLGRNGAGKTTCMHVAMGLLPPRRGEVRVKLRVPVRITGQAADGSHFDVLTMTENVSQNGFLCACNVDIHVGSIIELSLASAPTPVGKAKIIRSEWQDTKYPRYGCRFTEKTGAWVVQ